MCTAASLPPLSPHSSLPDLPSKGEGVGRGGAEEAEIKEARRAREKERDSTAVYGAEPSDCKVEIHSCTLFYI